MASAMTMNSTKIAVMVRSGQQEGAEHFARDVPLQDIHDDGLPRLCVLAPGQPLHSEPSARHRRDRSFRPPTASSFLADRSGTRGSPRPVSLPPRPVRLRRHAEGQPDVVPRDRPGLGGEGVLARHVEDAFLQAPRKQRPVETRVDPLGKRHPDEQPPVGMGPVDLVPHRLEVALEGLEEVSRFRPYISRSRATCRS